MVNNGGNAVKFINQGNYSPKSCQISDYFDTKYTKVVPIELALQKFEYSKIGNVLNLKQVYFRMTLVMCVSIMSSAF